MDKIFGDGIKKFVLMGIGAAAMTVEKSQQMVDELVKKGELTVEQGKELNQELKRNVKKTIDEAAEKKEAEEKKEATLEEKIAMMSAEELENLKAFIEKTEAWRDHRSTPQAPHHKGCHAGETARDPRGTRPHICQAGTDHVASLRRAAAALL